MCLPSLQFIFVFLLFQHSFIEGWWVGWLGCFFVLLDFFFRSLYFYFLHLLSISVVALLVGWFQDVGVCICWFLFSRDGCMFTYTLNLYMHFRVKCEVRICM